jgi:hypothetical protein
MNNNTVTTVSTMDSLIGVYRSHVLGRTLPTPFLVNFYSHNREIVVQAGGGLDPVTKLGNLLLWACTLADVTAKWKHTRDGRLHVSVTGRTSGGTKLEVYGGGEFTDCLGLIPLKAGEFENVSLDELYTLVGLLREAQQEAQQQAQPALQREREAA